MIKRSRQVLDRRRLHFLNFQTFPTFTSSSVIGLGC